jgi:hypothetical protein
MSLSALVPISALSSTLPISALAGSPVSSATQAAAASTATNASANDIATTGSSSLQAVTSDLVALLKALASGNVSESKASLARLQADIKTQQSASATAATASEQPPFNVVLNRVAESLAAADTGKALQDLASYLIQGGQASGNLVDERA